MDSANTRRNSSQKTLEVCPIRKIKRIQHIKSLPAYDPDLIRRNSLQKIETHISKDQHEIKLKRFKTQQSLKPPNFGAVKTARDRNVQWARKRQQLYYQSKSLTKSTTYRSPHEQNSRMKKAKNSKDKSKKSMKKAYSNIMNRVKNVIQEYQLKLDKCKQEKQEILKQNLRLKNQFELVNKRYKKAQR